MTALSQIKTDVLIIGAGPSGLSLARVLATSGLKITLIEKNPESLLQDPPFDGRDIALTHYSREVMQELGMWQHIPQRDIYRLRDAKVVNGVSDYQLHFPQPNTARGKPADSLGFLVSNHNIRKAAYASIQGYSNITLMCEHTATDVKTTKEHAYATLDNGQIVKARLLVAADSRLSQVRNQLGISADIHDFGRTVIVFRVKHTISNNHSAFECFHYGRTLALLPLESHLTNCVITINNDKATDLLKLSPEDLARDVEQQLNGHLGSLSICSTVHHYPLVGVHANAFYTQRAALIGDAAVGMHPVTAHGFNLGLQSALLLGERVIKAHQQGKSIASHSLLTQYQQKHILHTRLMYHGTNAIVSLFTNDTPYARVFRSMVIRASDHLPPLKNLIIRQLTG